jgi:multidrug efflux system membrane fusion protein
LHACCVIFSLLSLTVLNSCNTSTADSQPPPSPPTVKIAQPIRQTITQWDEYTGRIEAVNLVELRARVSGYLEKVQFKAGDHVKKGDLLFVLDNKPYKAQLNVANAELEKNKTKRDLAKNELERAQHLIKANAISTEEFDNHNHAFREAVAAVDAAEANVVMAKINLDYCEIKAPISGRITQETLTEGNLINTSEKTPLATIMSTDPIYMYAHVDEQAILKYRRHAMQKGNLFGDIKGMPVTLKLSGEQDFTHQGHIDYISPQEDITTSTITVRSIFNNPDEFMNPGYFARIRIQSETPYDALLLPDRAIGTDQAQHFVWVVKEDNQVEYRQVTIGTHAQNLRIITDGIADDEWIIVDGLMKVKPNIKVNPERMAINTAQEHH